VSRGWLRALSALVCLALVLLPAMALAADPDITVGVDTQRVGVGDIVRLTLRVSATQRVGAPQLAPIQGLTVVGSTSGPTQSITIVNGQMTAKKGLDASWSLRAEKVGRWQVGPVTLQVGSARYRADPITVVVVPAGQAPHRNPDPFGIDPFGGGNPFDPFKGLFDSVNPSPRDDDMAGLDPKLALSEARGTLAFLHATMDPVNAVVGQQVTVAMYLYTDPNEREANVADVHEATAADFLKRSLYEDDGSNRNVSRARAGGRVFNVRLLRKWALFPLKAGDLVVTPMDLTLVRSRLTGEPTRQSELLTVHVTEPPMDRRPPGYTLGDVGSYTLTTDVTPRDIEQDGAIGVTLTVAGTGNLPAMIRAPVQKGVEWLPPEVHEKVGAQAGDRFGGSRTFAYVVRLHEAGDIGLGAIGLPYWDPVGREYHVARSELGTVTVHPNANHTKVDSAPDILPNLPLPRASLGGTRSPPRYLADAHPGWFLVALGLAPVGFVLFAGASSTVKRVRERARERAASPATELATRMAAAEKASRDTDARALEAATARALEAASLAHVATNLRDARGGEARSRLIEAGVPEETAKTVEALLATCEAARFSPDDPPLDEARARWKEARDAIAALKSARRAA